MLVSSLAVMLPKPPVSDGPAAVPDGGTTILLLGVGLVAVTIANRVLSRNLRRSKAENSLGSVAPER